MNGPPTTLGQYQIIREIARSNDIVYEAYDPLMNRRVAVKELAVPPGSTPQQRDERISRFKREAQAAGTLNHPHIMTVFSFAEDAGRTFMAMEYLDGSTLRNEIDTKGFVPVERAVEIAHQVLDGLSHAHTKGVIHRDIKPDNIQILSTGQIKITDFGIARLTFQPNLTMDGQVFGTPSYMSPEQVVGKEIDARSDLFSVGVVLYEMISGQKPFPGDSVVSITYGIMNTEPAKPQQCSEAVWQVIRKSLDKSPMMRYSSAAELSRALEEALKVDSMSSQASMPSVFGQTSPYQTVPYQPFPQQPQIAPAPNYVFNPYQNAAAPVPGAPPVQSPYSQSAYNQAPYQQTYNSPYQANPYVPQQNTMLPPAYPPIYYPPPPRQPLLKPETADFIKKLVVTLVLVGTMFVLFIVGLQAITTALRDRAAERSDGQPLQGIDLDPRVPVDERIDQVRRRRVGLQSQNAIASANHVLAELVAEKGQAAFKQGDVTLAEALFKESVETDSSNAILYTNLASLYDQRAQNETDLQTRLTMWFEAGQNWEGAFSHSAAGDLKDKYGRGAAQDYYAYAYTLADSNPQDNRQAIRDALYRGMQCIDRNKDADLYRQMNELLDTVR